MDALKILVLAAAVLLVAPSLPGRATAAEPHGHGDHAAASGVTELTFDNGRKWGTDEPLRQGMDVMRQALATLLPRIHQGAFSPADYAALAGTVEQQVDYVTSNCRLPPEADMQLHVVLTQILDGAQEMQDGNRQGGAAQIVQALDAYARHFDHPGWQALHD